MDAITYNSPQKYLKTAVFNCLASDIMATSLHSNRYLHVYSLKGIKIRKYEK